MRLSKAFSTGTPLLKEYKHGDDVFLDCDEAFIHRDAEEDGGGLACSDYELINSQRKIILDIGRQLGRKLLSGNLNLINISLPVVMFESRSYLQKLADPWVHPVHLERAAACSNPVERMKLTLTWFLAGLQHVFCSWRKPFNPLLGETWQAELSSGTRIFTEQVSHHPPVTAFHMEGRAGLYTFDGLSQPQVSFSSGGLKTSARGYRRITFASDGAVISIKYPYYRIGGLLSGIPHGLIKGTATLTDTLYNITATVTFGPIQGANSRLLTRSDSLAVHIQGPAAAAATVIAVPDWISAAAAERERDVAAAQAAAAAKAAEATLAAVQGIPGLTAGFTSQTGGAAAAGGDVMPSVGAAIGQQTEAAGCNPQQHLLAGGKRISSSSHDVEVEVNSRRRSKSSSELHISPLHWLGKPARKLRSLSRARSKRSSSSSSKQDRSHTSGIGLGACFPNFSRNCSSATDASSSSNCSSRSTSPDISRANSSRSCPGAGGLSSRVAAAAAGQEGSGCVQPHGHNPNSRVAASNSPGPSPLGVAKHLEASLTLSVLGDSENEQAQGAASLPRALGGAHARPKRQELTRQLVYDNCRVQLSGVSSGGLDGAAPSFTIKTVVLPEQQPGAIQQGQEGQTVQQQRQQYYASQPQQLLASGTGNWLSHLDFGGLRYWTLSEDKPEHWISLHQLQQGRQQKPQQQQQEDEEEEEERASCEGDGLCPMNVLLPSDSQLRADLVAFRESDPQAQQRKEHLEHQQRRDAKMRPSFPHIDCAEAD